MSRPTHRTAPPTWAVEQARAESDSADPDVVKALARTIAADAAQIEAERHDEYDDPDQGGEG